MIPPTTWDSKYIELLTHYNSEMYFRATCIICHREFVRGSTGSVKETCSKACYKRMHRRETLDAQRAIRIRFELPSNMPWPRVLAELRSGSYTWKGPSLPPYIQARDIDYPERSRIAKDSKRFTRMPDTNDGRTKRARLYPHPRAVPPEEISIRVPVNFGERHYNATLTESDVLEIRKRAEAGETQRAIAMHYGVSQPLITAIVTGKSWAHVGGPIHKADPTYRYNLKLTPEIAATIRRLSASGISAPKIACELGLGETTIRRVLRGEAKY